MKQSLILLLIYVPAAVVVAGVWTYWAQTENQENRWGSIVAIADGAAPLPFVKRRLLCDGARIVARLVPVSLWTRASQTIDAQPRLTRLVREHLGWARRDDPLLLSATALIAFSVLGFMVAVRGITRIVYEPSVRLANLTGLILGFALLGGGSEASYGYPYDIPHACVFAAGLAALLSGSPWLFPAFAAAAYSKETAMLLIPGAVLVHQGRPDWRLALRVGTLIVLFVLIRKAVDQAYGPGSGAFWFPKRNLKLVFWNLVFGCWIMPVLLIAAVRVVRLWHAFPVRLRRLAYLAVVPLGAAAFKGWIEERRQYMELLPILGPLAVQWVFLELGLDRLCQVRLPIDTDRGGE